jgi:hypothetical protein
MPTEELDKTAYAFMTGRPEGEEPKPVGGKKPTDEKIEEKEEEPKPIEDEEPSDVESSVYEDDPLLNPKDEDEDENDDLDAFEKLQKEIGDESEETPEEEVEDGKKILAEEGAEGTLDFKKSEGKEDSDDTKGPDTSFDGILEDPKPKETTKEDAYDYGISTEDSKFIEDLPYEDQEILDVWKHAEKKEPKKYTGKVREHVEFLKSHNDFVETRLESGDYDSEEDILRSDEYETFQKENRPKVTSSEFKRAEKDFIYDEAARRAEEKLNPVKKELEDLKLRPKIEEQASKFQENLGDFLPEPVINTLKETPGQEGLKKLQNTHPIEAQVASEIYGETAELGKELIRLHSGVSQVDLDNNPVHQKLGDTVVRFGEDMMKLPEDQRQRDGKDFIPRDKFVQLPEADRANHWTFSNSDVLKLMATDMKLRIDSKIQTLRAQQEETEKAIFAKYGVTLEDLQKKSNSPVTPKAVKVEDKEEPSSPRFRPKPVGDAGKTKEDSITSFFTSPLDN